MYKMPIDHSSDTCDWLDTYLHFIYIEVDVCKYKCTGCRSTTSSSQGGDTCYAHKMGALSPFPKWVGNGEADLALKF